MKSVMTGDKKFWMLRAMRTYGGSFIEALARVWGLADDDNLKRLEEAFPEFVEHYVEKGKDLQKIDEKEDGQ